jgi:hypothetical protein
LKLHKLDEGDDMNTSNIYARGDRWFYDDPRKGKTYDVTNVPFWWTCRFCGHRWQESIRERIDDPKCPVCEGNPERQLYLVRIVSDGVRIPIK